MYFWDKEVLTDQYLKKHRINMNGRITSFWFYNHFLKELFDYVQSNKNPNEPPVISIVGLEWIDSEVLPLLISSGLVMRKHYAKPIPIEMIYNPRIIAYLDTTMFFFYGKQLEIFDFDEEYVGGYSWKYKYNDEYRLTKMPAIFGYYEMSKNEQIEKKYQTQAQLEKIDIHRIFGTLISKVINTESKEYRDCIRGIAEIVCNAQLYSMDVSFVCVQAITSEVCISISDIGIGISESLQKKGVEFDLQVMSLLKTKKEALESGALKDFIGLFTALKISESDKRDFNLWSLIRHVTEHKGTIRIHTNRIQVLFTSNKCGGCKNHNSINCMQCVLRRFTSDFRYSPLRIFRENLPGVHIEIDFIREGNENEIIL